MELIRLHHAYGQFIGDRIRDFLAGYSGPVDLAASHGHTVFHQPDKGITFQLGEGSSIAAHCRLTTVSDFRTLDVSLGGQGAPLVPVGDELLFGEYTYCLNLGGFANISFRRLGKRIACDICPVNIVANSLAQRTGQEFDRNGETGRRGALHATLVEELNHLDFYTRQGPKSLGREWVEEVFMPVLDRYTMPLENRIRSFYEHAAIQIAGYLNESPSGRVLVTGGGAFNTFLVERIRELTQVEVVIPEDQTVKFKEAIIFAFLGLLRQRGEINCLSSVTGASVDSSCGVIHLMKGQPNNPPEKRIG
jgi:anhydro-N-acetylmuramic acid kinase